MRPTYGTHGRTQPMPLHQGQQRRGLTGLIGLGRRAPPMFLCLCMDFVPVLLRLRRVAPDTRGRNPRVRAGVHRAHVPAPGPGLPRTREPTAVQDFCRTVAQSCALCAVASDKCCAAVGPVQRLLRVPFGMLTYCLQLYIVVDVTVMSNLNAWLGQHPVNAWCLVWLAYSMCTFVAVISSPGAEDAWNKMPVSLCVCE